MSKLKAVMTAPAGTRFFQLPGLDRPGFVHGFGTIDAGPGLRLARARIRESFPSVLELATVHQAHGRRAVRVANLDQAVGLRRISADVIAGDLPGVAVAVRTADCAPILLLDPERRAVAAVHAGWRGTAAEVVEAAVEFLEAEFGSRPERLFAGIGPCVGPCHYQVDQPVIEGIAAALGKLAGKTLAPDGPGRSRLDLALANRLLLERTGVPAKNIQSVGLCTFCHPGFFHSYRREGKGVASLYHFIARVGD